MTDDERQAKRRGFIDRWKHEFGGMILDGMQHRDGSHAALFARQILSKVDKQLAAIFDDMMPALPLPSANGAAKAEGVKR